MILFEAAVEPHAHGWRWFLTDKQTGARVLTGQHVYFGRGHALGVGDRQVAATYRHHIGGTPDVDKPIY